MVPSSKLILTAALCLLALSNFVMCCEARQHVHHAHKAGNKGERMRLAKTEPEQPSEGDNKIPHILHYVYLSGFDEFKSISDAPRSRMSMKFYDSCLEVHPHWEVKFWSMEKAEQLIKEHYSWFLPVWDTYDMEVKKADAIRPFILHHYGGMYLDLDNECYAPAERVFKQYDLVLQGSGFEGVNNGMMASAPGHPLWMKLVDVLKERHVGSADNAHLNSPLHMTGPAVLIEAVKRAFNLDKPHFGFENKEYQVDGLVSKVYPIGEFFMPCWQADLVCQRQLEAGLAAGSWDTANLVGRHWFAGTWNTPAKLRPAMIKAKVTAA